MMSTNLLTGAACVIDKCKRLLPCLLPQLLPLPPQQFNRRVSTVKDLSHCLLAVPAAGVSLISTKLMSCRGRVHVNICTSNGILGCGPASLTRRGQVKVHAPVRRKSAGPSRLAHGCRCALCRRAARSVVQIIRLVSRCLCAFQIRR